MILDKCIWDPKPRVTFIKGTNLKSLISAPLGHRGNRKAIWGTYWGYTGDNGKENGNYYLEFRGLGLGFRV